MRPPRVLFVTPCTHSSGEAVTALHVARDLRVQGVDCRFIATPNVRALVEPADRDRVRVLGESRDANQSLWRKAVNEWAPDAIVFADYPLLFFSSGVAPLADPQWADELREFGGAVLTMDHMGYAQGRKAVYFGPRHLTFGAEVTVDIPDRMEILLPCPTHEPGFVQSRKGVPVRCWDPTSLPAAQSIREIRQRYLDGDQGVLVFHSTPSWATRLAAQLELPHYHVLLSILQEYLAGAAPVTVVCVNDGSVPAPTSTNDVRFVSLAPLPPPEYEALLCGADLMLTDNAVSASLGKAVCARVPCALLRNSFDIAALRERAADGVAAMAIAMENERPGAIFPYDVFPVWDEGALDDLGFRYTGSYGRAFAQLELFGGESTRAAISALLFDAATRSKLRDAQRRYVAEIDALPSAAEVILGRLGLGNGTRQLSENVRARAGRPDRCAG